MGFVIARPRLQRVLNANARRSDSGTFGRQLEKPNKQTNWDFLSLGKKRNSETTLRKKKSKLREAQSLKKKMCL